MNLGHVQSVEKYRIPSFLRGENPAVYRVDETLSVSFAHQNATRSGGWREPDNVDAVNVHQQHGYSNRIGS